MSQLEELRNTIDYHIFLIGFMGAGKSTIAKALQEKLQLERLEMDQMIAEREGKSIPEIFAEQGENYFRDAESRLLIDLGSHKPAIVSCGGGVIVRAENADHMKKHGRIVLLTATPETILERVKDSNDRPILNNHMNVEFIEGLLEKRREKYEAAAEIVVATDHKTVDEICEEIVEKLLAYQS